MKVQIYRQANKTAIHPDNLFPMHFKDGTDLFLDTEDVLVEEQIEEEVEDIVHEVFNDSVFFPWQILEFELRDEKLFVGDWEAMVIDTLEAAEVVEDPKQQFERGEIIDLMWLFAGPVGMPLFVAKADYNKLIAHHQDA